MESITLHAADISCEHCQTAIESSVGALDGVKSVAVDIPERTVRVSFDPDAVSSEAILSTMDEEGYPAIQTD